ncbi:18S PRE-RIBOSOMAL ASSEMBLY PROTEIN GAR2-LIKE PROTEIN [Salix koriyanagi]|uniref:18S PRE-RIBOSOMAL ASSEMBLY PROTEIN GAR2-LIKE PROTEIN n=1 Tax=Salix koriyanagi TaxID=2511006 RepID=A0A9Q1AHZ4_9ROSI|nr:18S PRE-RIBOSOMAL ASSEMBLY PROTEIN GAR2-LIKE PROTEIN [Salix koriyanagi]
MGHEPDCRPVEYNDNVLDSVGLKSGNAIAKENENRELYDLNGMEGDADRLPNAAPAPTPNSSLKMKPFEDSVFYMDKSVLGREVPELIVCYKENTYHVKDICIDEGLPLQDKFLFDTDAREKNVCEFLPSARDMNNKMVKENSDLDIDMLIPDGLKSSSEKQNASIHFPVRDMLRSSYEQDSKYESPLDYDPKDLVPTEEVIDYVTEKVADDGPVEILSLRDLLSMPELGEKFTSTTSNHSVDEVERQSIQCPRENTILESDSASEESENHSEEAVSNLTVALRQQPLAVPAQDPACQEAEHSRKEAVSASPTLTSAAGKSDSSNVESKLASHALDSVREELASTIMDQLPYDSKAETRSITASGRKSPENGDHSQCLAPGISSRFEDPNTEPFSGRLYTDGESSFSATGSLSGLVSYSGPIPYSGSISLRSDSSTTSTRSFAFPVLQSEWNSSPVRMAKAGRRHLQKPRRWMQGLLCCRF